MTQLQLGGYARLVTPKLIVVMVHLVQLTRLRQPRELKPANLGWLKTSYLACLAIQASISSG